MEREARREEKSDSKYSPGGRRRDGNDERECGRAEGREGGREWHLNKAAVGVIDPTGIAAFGGKSLGHFVVHAQGEDLEVGEGGGRKGGREGEEG